MVIFARLKPTLLLLLSAAVTLAVAATPAAHAQSPAGTGYDETGVIETLGDVDSSPDVVPPPEVAGDLPEVVDVAGGAGPSATRESGGDVPAASLPFTGFDAGLIGLMGLALLATGFLLRRSRHGHR